MFPNYTPEFARAQHSYRLEGFRRWSRLRGGTGGPVGVDDTQPQEKGHHRLAARPAVSR